MLFIKPLLRLAADDDSPQGHLRRPAAWHGYASVATSLRLAAREGHCTEARLIAVAGATSRNLSGRCWHYAMHRAPWSMDIIFKVDDAPQIPRRHWGNLALAKQHLVPPQGRSCEGELRVPRGMPAETQRRRRTGGCDCGGPATAGLWPPRWRGSATTSRPASRSWEGHLSRAPPWWSLEQMSTNQVPSTK